MNLGAGPPGRAGRRRRRGALQVVTTTLDAMASGGIYDHLGGGFARYSVDERWLVPHFEKMLYDQALLVPLYLHAWQVTGEARYRQVVEETVGYVLRRAAPPRRRVLLLRGRGLGGRGGPLLPLDPGAGRRRGRAGARAGRARVVRRDGGRQLRGPHHPHPPRARRPGAAAGGRAGPGPAVRGPRRAGPARAGRQGPHRVERPHAGRPGRGRRRAAAGRTGWTPPAPTPSCC